MLRPAHPADYPAIARIHNTLWPEHFRSLEDFAHLDRHNPVRRFLLELVPVPVVEGLHQQEPGALERGVGVRFKLDLSGSDKTELGSHFPPAPTPTTAPSLPSRKTPRRPARPR